MECCSKCYIVCEECPANGLCDDDDYCFTGAILDLINRQKAEIERLMQKLQQPQTVKCKDNEVKCKDCEYLMFSDMYGECSKCYKGIVRPNDSCGKGILRKVKK